MLAKNAIKFLQDGICEGQQGLRWGLVPCLAKWDSMKEEEKECHLVCFTLLSTFCEACNKLLSYSSFADAMCGGVKVCKSCQVS